MSRNKKRNSLTIYQQPGVHMIHVVDQGRTTIIDLLPMKVHERSALVKKLWDWKERGFVGNPPAV